MIVEISSYSIIALCLSSLCLGIAITNLIWDLFYKKMIKDLLGVLKDVKD